MFFPSALFAQRAEAAEPGGAVSSWQGWGPGGPGSAQAGPGLPLAGQSRHSVCHWFCRSPWKAGEHAGAVAGSCAQCLFGGFTPLSFRRGTGGTDRPTPTGDVSGIRLFFPLSSLGSLFPKTDPVSSRLSGHGEAAGCCCAGDRVTNPAPPTWGPLLFWAPSGGFWLCPLYAPHWS